MALIVVFGIGLTLTLTLARIGWKMQQRTENARNAKNRGYRGYRTHDVPYHDYWVSSDDSISGGNDFWGM
ncbi:MAG: hypothetical protein M0Z41_08895 [Peptococcaceae bacterium]|jgi:hypothetical protein|nr:hypothetical protein [Peptococcaceae bacterium]